jgi:hypothetical protein
LVGKPEGKRTLGRSREDSVGTNLGRIGQESAEWIRSLQDRVQ